MARRWHRVGEALRSLHEDEGGTPELSHVMIVALISVPLVVALILFGQKVFDWFTKWQKALSK